MWFVNIRILLNCFLWNPGFVNKEMDLMSVWPCIVDDMKRVKRTRCYTMVYWTLWIAQHISGITMPIVRSLRLYRWSQRVAPHLGYGRLLVWCMAVGFSRLAQPVVKHPSNRTLQNLQPTRPATCHNQGEVPYAEAICIVASSWRWA